MGLEPGARFGPCQIVARLGAGGLGEVYRARDTRREGDIWLADFAAGPADETKTH